MILLTDADGDDLAVDESRIILVQAVDEEADVEGGSWLWMDLDDEDPEVYCMESVKEVYIKTCLAKLGKYDEE